MATSVTYVGNSYSVPAYNDTGYAQGAGNLSSYLVALATGSLTLSGGSFPLTADANFGASFGLVALYFKSQAANIAASGVIRLASTDLIAWRNNANNADVQLTKNTSDNLSWPNAILAAAHVTQTANPAASGVIRLANTESIAWRNAANSADKLLSVNASDALTYAAATVLNSSGQLAATFASLTSATANAAAAGAIRLANADTINWRNNANSADKALSVDTSDRLNYAGAIIANAAGALNLANVTGTLAIGNGGTNSASALTNSRVMVSSGGAIIESTLATINSAGYLIGNILQVVTGTTTTVFSTSSSTFQTSSLTASITPKSTTSKIFIFATGTLQNSSTATQVVYTLARGGVNLFTATGLGFFLPTASATCRTPASIAYWDSPASTSAQTYAVQIRSTDNATSVSGFASSSNETCILLLVEVAQ